MSDPEKRGGIEIAAHWIELWIPSISPCVSGGVKLETIEAEMGKTMATEIPIRGTRKNSFRGEVKRRKKGRVAPRKKRPKGNIC